MTDKKQKIKKEKPTCYVLFSGGLDSRLAIKITQEQKNDNLEIIAITFKLPFGAGCFQQDCSFNFCQVQGIKQKIIDCTKGKLFKEYLKMIAKPKFGYGSALNPCIDCRIFILKYIKKFLKKNDFVVTGEVLNERPMSQHYKALMLIEKETKLEGKILRPLSAKLLPKTAPEKNKLVDREKFLDISGRSRKKQIELANYYKISYPSPAGGCLLCEKVFAERLKDLLKRKEIGEIEPRDVELLKVGRHFFFSEFKIIVGRNHEENLKLKNLKNNNEKIFELKSKPGPSVLLQGKISEESIKKAKEFVLKFSKNKDDVIEV
ncbi:MAG: tRNA 4-thiouridine(8) synthase ThiI [Candidatus Pacearchaeota archaeon]